MTITKGGNQDSQGQRDDYNKRGNQDSQGQQDNYNKRGESG